MPPRTRSTSRLRRIWIVLVLNSSRAPRTRRRTSSRPRPTGVTAVPQTMGGGVRETQLVLTASADAAAWTGEIKVKGTAAIKGQPVVREARAGGVVWPSPQPQQAMPLAGRLERSVVLAVRPDKAAWSVTPAI